MARLRAKYIRISPSKEVNVDEFEALMLSDFKASVEAEIFMAISAFVNDLQKLIEELNNKSSNRGRGINRFQYNQPMNDAIIRIRVGGEDINVFSKRQLQSKKFQKKLLDKVQIDVVDYVFNRLDQGRPDRTLNKPEKMMTYTGHLTSPDSVNIGSAVAVGHIHNLAAGTIIKGFKPRRFLVNLVKQHRGRRRVKLSEAEQEKIFTEFNVQEFHFEIDPALITVRIVK